MQDTKEQWLADLLKDGDGGKMTEKQARIVQAAIEIFAEKGFAASSTSEIAQRAGVAEGTIFRHYKTKKELLLAIVAPTLTKLIAPLVLRDLNKVLDEEYDSLEQFLRAVIANRIEFLDKHQRIIRIAAQEISFHPELQEHFKNEVMNRVLDRLRSVIERLKSEGKVAAMPSETIIRLIGSSLFGYMMIRSFYGSREGAVWDDEREREETIAFIVRGLGAPKVN
ncbi:TetR/AcrR family transcriptional regulator [Paenibacillus humicola]|uniref:TetR/AcrR family transcriptional regulator n=1 Tax=Paenibacillus humicola TaxID=3110540 RepID=UPI00237B4FAD|nr:TetR/AcrR family transcriptional regulator [Paenibacillus humicola]